jgi:hypothetical protein
VRVREAGRQRRESKAVGERSGKQAPEGEKSQESRGVREGEGRGGEGRVDRQKPGRRKAQSGAGQPLEGGGQPLPSEGGGRG